MIRRLTLLYLLICCSSLTAQDTLVNLYPNGKLKDLELFSNGKRHGRSLYYYPNGQLSSVEEYNQDSLVSWNLYRPDGRPDTAASPTSGGFPGGWPAFHQYIANNIDYAPKVKINNISGKCYVEFTIDTLGMVRDIHVLRGIKNCMECDLEVRRLLGEMPPWIPVRRHNRLDNAKFRMPILFNVE